MKYLKKYEEKETDEYWNKLKDLEKKDINSKEYQDTLSKLFQIDRKYEKYKYKYIIATVNYNNVYRKKETILAKCISIFLNHMHLEVYYKQHDGKYNKFKEQIKIQDITILNSFDTFKEAEETFENIIKYNL